MKKLVRSISTRRPKFGSELTTPTTPTSSDRALFFLTSTGILSPTKSDHAHFSTPSLIPPNTTLYFPQCPHSTPPTPQPAGMAVPLALKAQASAASSAPSTPLSSTLDNSIIHSPASNTSHREEWDRIDITSHPSVASPIHESAFPSPQFFTSPKRCFDCTISLARTTQKTTHQAFDPKIQAARQALRVAMAAEQAADDTTPDPARLREWVSQAKGLVGDFTAQRDAEVKAIWHDVIKAWEGGVREVIRDDGTGQGLELCRFKMVYVDVDPLEESEVTTQHTPATDLAQQVGSSLEILDGWKVDVEWHTQ
ncbi:hypothetical protein PV10_00701 [Exophiala mesophila]|uniref:Uncharacterized protein n=1 Tax=Exophiala mesophila TaxID=212818 RepID=A0A0D1ZQK4_EXOME|nr:uncharacterized protein PV10_00701 [Exophiala mesophila]KIV96887.1 hypothetical protein PV10_00701 [Exophiala mesophila]